MGSYVANWRPRVGALLAALLVAVAAPAELAFAATTAASDSQAASVTGYARSGIRPQAMPDAALPYNDTPLAPRVDPGLHDDQGVRMFRYNDEIYDHPVAQAQWGLSNVRTYLVNRDRSYLDRAVAQAQRNLDRRVESRGAWWYPYEFDVPACGQLPVIQAPWYSAMSQGQLLSLFVRLYQVTGDQKWREAADLTFASLLLPPGPGLPWASWVDDAGYLWLEEYPVTPGVTGERVLNGHIFALYGVYDYWRLTADSRAVAIFDGAATTLSHYVPTALRMPEWVSRYAVGCPNAYIGYHALHIQQLLKVYEMSRSAVFASLADLLRDDYPPPTVTGTVVFAGGTHVGYTFNSTGAILEQKSLTLSRQSNANADQRIRVRGRGVYYRIQNGSLAGYFVAEEPGTRVLLGAVAMHTYAPQRTLLFSPGTYMGHRYGPAWTVAESRTYTFARASAAPFDATAWVNGRLCYRITAGAYAGLWLPAVEGLDPA
ncbi:D-glucuronyl C5-epimerase family protein [Micromonospora sp. NPDC049836]|uniref:D-glucuronyl C5-epimerase family protein n=1 Tax=Micromonospora sp. NPDC049836 TaxID=3364274 RepID=UPI00379C9EF2